MSFDTLWSELLPVGLVSSGGYRRFAWSPEDALMREWFAGAAAARGMALTVDRCGNQWAWWGTGGEPGVVVGSHLDSVPDGGAYDGPLGIVSAFLAVDALQNRGFAPSRPIGVVNFCDEEGARFGVACAGSRLLTGQLDAAGAMRRTDGDGITMAEAMTSQGIDPSAVGRDTETLNRVASYLELHIEQGRGLIDLGHPIAVGSAILAHGRWRLDLRGEANHAGTTQLGDRRDPMLALAHSVLAARSAAERAGCLATIGKLRVSPNGVNAIPSIVTAWLDARATSASAVREVVAAVEAAGGVDAVEESWSPATSFDHALTTRVSSLLDGAPILATGAGHDAGILSAAGIPSTMLFVRNPTGVSHSPAETAERSDCLAGVDALVTVLEQL